MRNLFTALLILTLTACASSPPADFTIQRGKLKENEIVLNGLSKVNLASRVFDVVNQDTGAESGTGIAGKVEPMPADILSAYAAKKFNATGGELTTRFVIHKAGVTVRSVEIADKGWLWGWPESKSYKAEMSVNLSVMLVASRLDGRTAHIDAETQQAQQIATDTTPEARRKAYLALMQRAIQGIDDEISRRLPEWFDEIVVR